MKAALIALSLMAGTVAYATPGTLNAKISPSAAFVLPVSLRSCQAEAASSASTDLPANTIEFTRLQYSWNGTGTYTMSAIVLDFKNPILSGGKYQCVIAGDELSFLLPQGGSVIDPWDTNKSFNARCSLRCGGINITSNVNSVQLNGELKIYGTETDLDGKTQPITTVLPVSMYYEKF